MRRDTAVTLSVITGLVVLGSWFGQPGPPPDHPATDGRPLMTVQELEDMNAQAGSAAADAASMAAADAAAAATSEAPPVAPPIPIEALTRTYRDLPDEAADGTANEGLTFNGYPCTVDCSGHRAGYEWADRNWITDPSECWNHSRSFEQGCMSWIEEQAYAAGCSDEELDEGSCEW